MLNESPSSATTPSPFKTQDTYFGAKKFKPTPNASPQVQKAEKEFMEQLKGGTVSVTKEGSLNSGMILGKVEEWIKLLVATLKNQDPTNPVDHKEMVTQFAQFAQTMGMNEIKNFLQEFKRMMGTTQVLEAANQVDKMLEVETDKFMHLKNHPIEFGFDAPEEAKKASILIVNDKGAIIRMIEGECKPGKNTFRWDGKNAEGSTATEGLYSFYVVPLDKDNQRLSSVGDEPLTIKTYITGIGHGAEMKESGSFVKINNVPYALESLRGVDSIIKLQEVKSEETALKDRSSTQHPDNLSESSEPVTREKPDLADLRAKRTTFFENQSI